MLENVSKAERGYALLAPDGGRAVEGASAGARWRRCRSRMPFGASPANACGTSGQRAWRRLERRRRVHPPGARGDPPAAIGVSLFRKVTSRSRRRTAARPGEGARRDPRRGARLGRVRHGNVAGDRESVSRSSGIRSDRDQRRARARRGPRPGARGRRRADPHRACCSTWVRNWPRNPGARRSTGARRWRRCRSRASPRCCWSGSGNACGARRHLP